MPGLEFEVPIKAIPFGSAEGVFAPRNGLPSLREIGDGSRFIVTMYKPDEASLEAVQLGASGTVLILTEEAGAISALAEILFWIGKMMNNL